jgi:hypothetical protein
MELAFAAEDAGFEIELPTFDNFETSPSLTFERHFLPRLLGLIENRPLLILLDEFEELEVAVNAGRLDASVFSFMRHLIQHTPQLNIVFCGTHRLEELAADYWSVLFNISLHHHIDYLTRDQALQLVQQPVAPFGLTYDDLALDKLWLATAGHPYFLQLLCHRLVELHNHSQRSYMTIADVNEAIEQTITVGEAHFIYLWNQSTFAERLILMAMGRIVPYAGTVSLVHIADYLESQGANLPRQTVRQGLHKLTLRRIVHTETEWEAGTGERYRWLLGLLGVWIMRTQSLSRVLETKENE